MPAYVATPVRALLLAVALVFAGSAATATPQTEQTHPTARATARTKAEPGAEREDPPLDGILIILGIIGLVILIAWIGSRISDNRSHVTN